MRVRGVLLSLLLLATLLATAPAASADEGLDALPHSFDFPLLVTAPEGDDRVFVIEREGLIQVVEDGGQGAKRVFADLRSLVDTAGEGGLLGLAFSPDFATDGRFWVNYTADGPGDVPLQTRVERIEVNSAGTAAVMSSRTRVLTLDQPFSNHNGGMIAFAPDDTLLVALGDGGSASDPRENGQDTSNLFGTVLRLDVKDRSGDGYGVPADNPFVGQSGRDEIWLYGLRNPYRFSVDRTNGDVWIGDVGQNTREEVDRVPYRPTRVFNLGWDRWEGNFCHEDCGGRSGLTFPVHEYAHADGGCSITGGNVVRTPGSSLAGSYLFADLCLGKVEVYDPRSGDVRDLAGGGVGGVFGFGEDGDGDVYVTTRDRVFRVDDSGTRFVDVPSDDVFADDIERLAATDVTRGCNPPANDRFCPDDPVTRAEMAAFITRAAGYARQGESFSDVTSSNVFAGDIGAIAANDVTRGCNPPANDRFCPGETVKRAQMAAFLTRALDYTPQAESFSDVASSNVFAGDIGAIAANDVTRGCNPPANDRYCPDDPVTREQMAAFLVRAFDL